MPNRPYPIQNIVHFRAKCQAVSKGVSAIQVQQEVVGTLSELVGLSRPERCLYDVKDLFSVVSYAASTSHSVEEAGHCLVFAPHPNTVRAAFRGVKMAEIDKAINEALARYIPKGLLSHPLELAVDLTYVPYYGSLEGEDEEYLFRGTAKKGTNVFLVYGSCYVIEKEKRGSLAMVMGKRSGGVLGALKGILERFLALGGKVECLYLDRGFFSVPVLRYLIDEANIPFLMAVPKKGEKSGIKSLCEGGGRVVFFPTK